MPQSVWERLAGRRIFCLGLSHRQKKIFLENLAYQSEQQGGAFTVAVQPEDVGSGDLVFLFADFETGEPSEVTELLAELEAVVKARPQSVVLVSEGCVYGKVFGSRACCKEGELGYISHTSRDGIRLQAMRTAEHFACRFAREESLEIKVVRADTGLFGEALAVMLEAAVCVLLCGNGGEIYNLPGAEKKEEINAENASVLSPAEVVMNTEKAELLKIKL